MRRLFLWSLLCLLLLPALSAWAQERAINKEVIVLAPVAAVWQSWTTKAGIEADDDQAARCSML